MYKLELYVANYTHMHLIATLNNERRSIVLTNAV